VGNYDSTIEEVKTGYRSPWQKAYVERLIGSARRECLDHVIVLGERHQLSLSCAVGKKPSSLAAF